MRLFISYAHTDREDVEELAYVLERGGFEAWYDYALVPGEVWRDRLAQEIAGCEAFLYALTPEAVNSEFCQWEFEKALELNKPVMPVLLKAGTERLPAFPAMLRDRQWADLTHGLTPENTAHLLNGLHRMQDLLLASPPSVSADKSAEFIAPGAMENSMSKPQDDDQPHISISQQADHSSNVTQIGYTKGDVHVNQGNISGDTYSGDFRGAILNVRSQMEHVTQTVQALPGADQATTDKIKNLTAQLKAALENLPPEHAQDAEAVSTATAKLVNEAAKPQPDRSLLTITGDGLKKAAENLAEVAPAVVGIAFSIVKTILSLGS